jgi:hypothetical protein
MSTLAVLTEFAGVMGASELELPLPRAKDIAEKLRKEIPPPEGNPQTAVAQYEVRSLVIYSKDPKTPFSYAVPNMPPQMAHWTVHVDDGIKQGQGYLCHLVLKEFVDEDGKTRLRVAWDFRMRDLGEGWEDGKLKVVGYTKYGPTELIRIGMRMIEEFGDYHVVFWNCQMFAKCFLSVITADEGVWDTWTSADAASLFLCALMLPAPFVASSWIKRKSKEKRILKAGKEAANQSEPSVNDVNEVLSLREQSERVIRKMYEEGLSQAQALEIERIHEQTGTLTDKIKRMFSSMMGWN